MTDDAVPPRVFGDRCPRSGFSSESISIELPILISACMMLSAGTGHAHRLDRAERLLVELDRSAAPLITRYGVNE